MRPSDRFFRIAATILVLTLATTVLWISAATAKTLQDITLEEIYNPKMPKIWREGFYTGMFLATPVNCRSMSTNMVIAAIEAALQAGEITRDWQAYQAMLYVLGNHGCMAEKPNV